MRLALVSWPRCQHQPKQHFPEVRTKSGEVPWHTGPLNAELPGAQGLVLLGWWLHQRWDLRRSVFPELQWKCPRVSSHLGASRGLLLGSLFVP